MFLYPYVLLEIYANTFNKGTFKALAVEVAKYLRCKAERKAADREKEAKLVWDNIHQFYFDLPLKEEFENVERRHFADDYKLVNLTDAVLSMGTPRNTQLSSHGFIPQRRDM